MDSRRDVKSRGKEIFHKMAASLIKVGLMPNHISIASIGFGALGAYGFYQISQGALGFGSGLAFLGIQLRLICNLIDGLMAVEGKLSSPQGELYNDVPDRFSDWFLILGVGFVIKDFYYGWDLAWAASVFAILTAYIRVLGASQQVGHDFGGPMAKQHRMALLNLGIIANLIEQSVLQQGTCYSFYVVIVLVLLGSALTCFKRLSRISKSLSEKA